MKKKLKRKELVELVAQEIKKKDKLYYARIIPSGGVYDVCEIKIRTIEDTYFVGIDKSDKHAYLFNNDDLNKIIFKSREDALAKVLSAEKNRKKVPDETYYEEY